MAIETRLATNTRPGQAAREHISYRVSHFDAARHADEEIARSHLAIRQWQIDVQGVTFSNFMNPGKNYTTSRPLTCDREATSS